MARTSASARPLTDHEEIRRWAEERGATPSCVRGTGDEEDVGMIRLDFPGYSGERSLEPIDWDEWLDKFDENNLALLVQEETARGQQSNFNKLVSRNNVESGGRTRRAKANRTPSSKGRSRGQSKSARARGSSSERSGRSRSARSAASTSSRPKRSTQKSARSGGVRGSARKSASRASHSSSRSRKNAA